MFWPSVMKCPTFCLVIFLFLKCIVFNITIATQALLWSAGCVVFFFFFFSFLYHFLGWNIVNLQLCVSFKCTAKWFSLFQCLWKDTCIYTYRYFMLTFLLILYTCAYIHTSMYGHAVFPVYFLTRLCIPGTTWCHFLSAQRIFFSFFLREGNVC